jgi:cytochrome c peroxidase
MKKIILLFPFLAIALIFNAFKTPATTAEQVRLQYLTDCKTFDKTVERLNTTAKNTPLSKTVLEADFKAARLAFKRIAWLIGYLDPDGEKEMNGAPLPEVELIHFSEIDPTGFQPIEEIIFSENPEEEAQKLQKLTQTLCLHAHLWRERMTAQLLSDREIFEAMRVELVQLFTLSLTGFDSPVAVHSLEEAAVSWANLEKNYSFYESILEKTDPSVARLLFDKFAEGKAFFLKNRDFDSFDRIAFYKNCLQPVYQNLVIAQQKLGIENYQLTSGFRRAWNDQAFSIFDKDFVDAKFFSKIKQKNHEDSPERIELGKILFFDPILSVNGKRSCATCHRPENAFAEPLSSSLDLTDKPVGRNAPSLIYSALATNQFWDGKANDVEDQLFHVASNLREMGNNIEDVPVRLAKSSEYIALFEKAFPNQTEALRVSNIQKAMGAYLRSLAVFDSEFDQFMRGETAKITPSVKNGFNLFMGKAKCGTCHFAPIFNGTVPPQYLDTEFEVLGILSEKGGLDTDLGRFHLYPAEKFRRAFKTVTVRNAALSAPYMHNGAQKTLAAVVDFYQKGGGVGMGFDVPNQTLPFDKLSLTKQEQADLVKFMESLTDKTLPKAPTRLPVFEDAVLNNRKIGGTY